MAINLVQSMTAFASNATSLSQVFTGVVSSGNLITVVHGMWHGANTNTFSTITDNVNNAGFTRRIFSTMSNASDTVVHLGVYDKLNISSGAGASTYRINLAMTGIASITFCGIEWSGGPFTFGSTGSSNGTSTGPRGPIQTASSTPALFVSGAVVLSTAQFRSTVVGVGTWLTTIDTGNTAQILNVAYSTHSSLTQQLTHAMTASTRWLAGTVLYLGLGSGGAAATRHPWQLCMGGVQ